MQKKFLKHLGVVVILSALILIGFGLQNNSSYAKSEKYEPLILNVATAGDINRVKLQEVIGKEFHLNYSNISVNVIGTGSGDSGSREIYNKLKAQKNAQKKDWDMDVAIVHQSIMKDLMEDGLLEKYVPLSDNKKYVISADSVNSLGVNVNDYVIPMYHNQLIIAYNSDRVKEVPRTFDQLEKWILTHPNRFAYNGISNDMSGAAFVAAFTYWKSEDYIQLTEGPYDPKLEEKWPKIMKELKTLPVKYSNESNDILEMLNRGEVDMGPVWSDSFLNRKTEDCINSNLHMMVLDPGLPAQTMYVVIPKKAKNKELVIQYADFLTSPEVQSKFIVEQYGLYPGIDPNVTLPKVSNRVKGILSSDITTEDIVKKSQSFPLNNYFNNLLIAYERY